MTRFGAVMEAICGSGIYFLGFSLFKVSTRSMPYLQGTRPLHFIGQILRHPVWLAGAAVMGAGAALQFLALALLPLPVAVAAFLVGGLPVLLVIACHLFGERVSRAEAWSFAALTVAALLITCSAAAAPLPVPPGVLVSVAVPSLVLPILLFSMGDARRGGVHARRLTGLAYGLSAGVLIGLAELALSFIAREGLSPATVTRPYPYLFALAVSTGIAQLQIALQRCRMVSVLFVATVTAKCYLVLVSGLILLLGPVTRLPAPGYLIAGICLLSTALVCVPRYEPRNDVERTSFRRGEAR